MKYCIEYKKNFKYMAEIEEVIIQYDYKNTNFINLLQEIKDKRIIIKIKDLVDFLENDRLILFDSIIKEISQDSLNITFLFECLDETTEKIIEKLRKEKYNYFFRTRATTWDILWGLVEIGVSDIYICEDLGFELDAVAATLHSLDIKIRAFPNVAQSSWKQTPAFKKFFIRPEDIEDYEPYIDIIEFYGREESIETCYRIYAIDKKWTGKLNELIIDFNDNVDNRYLIKNYNATKPRIKCRKKCLKGNPCKLCERWKEFANFLNEQELIPVKDKN